jgi:hypothetical protein
VELRDIIVTPIVIALVYFIAYLVKPKVTDENTRRYFYPALTLKILGALAVGFIYQFYYHGGDTFNFHTHGSRHMWEAFMDDTDKGIKLLLNDGTDYTGVYKYASQIYFFSDPQSLVIIKLAAVFDLLTFSSYSATAVLFCVVSFIGVWMFFLTWYDMYPHLVKYLAWVSLFIPSVVFWGSGLLKDTITLGCLGLATYCTYHIFIQRKVTVARIILLLLGCYILYSIKIYILLAYLPSVIVWIFMYNYRLLNSPLLKIALFPIVVGGTIFLGYFAVVKAGQGNARYSVDALAKTAQITAYDIRYWSGRDAGSGYSLGELDGTWQSLITLAPSAVNVSLFRPYLWESKNVLMILAALESFALLLLTLYTIKFARLKLLRSFTDPTIMFCLVFSLTFAFSVGVSTYNFGTLMRYKIPLMPFYSLALILIINYANKVRKEERFDLTE